MKMKNYTFTRDLNLGIVQISVRRGDIVTEKNGSFIYNNQKYDNTQDFKIALRNGWLVDSQNFVQAQEIVQRSKNNFGFNVQKQQQSTISIPVKRFQQHIVDEKNGFVEDGNEIKTLQQTGIHVATVTQNVNAEQPKQAITEPTKASQEKNDKQAEKKKTTVKTQAKQSKKEQPKKSRIIKESQIGKQQVVGESRGMKIIKGE